MDMLETNGMICVPECSLRVLLAWVDESAPPTVQDVMHEIEYYIQKGDQ